MLSPVALNGPAMTIRRFPEEGMTLDRLVALGSITEECKSFLDLLVKCRYNIVISGGTGSGKTTFLNALSQAILPEERIVTIEDSAELQLKYTQNLVSLETRNANMEGCRTISVRDLIRSSLRMRPDRIIVGEVRGAEICELLTAYNSGHAGSMSTGHGNTARDMLLRMETMLLMGMDIPLSAIRRQIASGIDILVHLGRMRDKTRKVLEIAEITGFSEGEITTRTLYAFEEDENSTREKVSGKLEKKGELCHVEKLEAALWLRIKQIIPNTGFPGRNVCSAFSKRFLQQVLLQGCSTGHGLECWRFRQYGRFYTDATKRTEFKKERKDFPCNLRIPS